MTSLYKSPGVHVESAGDRYVALEAVETGVTAFLGVTADGPRHEPTRVGSLRGPRSVTPRNAVTPVSTRSSGT